MIERCSCSAPEATFYSFYLSNENDYTMGTMKTRDKALVSVFLGLAIFLFVLPDASFNFALQAFSSDAGRCPLVRYKYTYDAYIKITNSPLDD